MWSCGLNDLCLESSSLVLDLVRSGIGYEEILGIESIEESDQMFEGKGFWVSDWGIRFSTSPLLVLRDIRGLILTIMWSRHIIASKILWMF